MGPVAHEDGFLKALRRPPPQQPRASAADRAIGWWRARTRRGAGVAARVHPARAARLVRRHGAGCHSLRTLAPHGAAPRLRPPVLHPAYSPSTAKHRARARRRRLSRRMRRGRALVVIGAPRAPRGGDLDPARAGCTRPAGRAPRVRARHHPMITARCTRRRR